VIAAAVRAVAPALGLERATVLVAVSGGVDSIVLLDTLVRARAELGLELAVGHVNHGLRGEASDADESLVKDAAARYGLPFLVRRVAPLALREGRSSRERPTLQEAARRVRYDALEAMAAEASARRIATAHTLDDQAETVLLRLLRGAGPDGLGGIPEQTPETAGGLRVVRPILGVSRAEIERIARERGLRWSEDASNRDGTFARARLRSDWLPGLGEAFNPQWLRAIGDLAEAQRRDSEWIDRQVEDECARRFRRVGLELQVAKPGFEELPEALARRVARQALREQGGGRDMSRPHLLRVVEFLRSGRTGKRLELPGGVLVVAEREVVRFVPPPGGVMAEC
jgi:tRNA(Ile)-lysidine synthase